MSGAQGEWWMPLLIAGMVIGAIIIVVLGLPVFMWGIESLAKLVTPWYNYWHFFK